MSEALDAGRVHAVLGQAEWAARSYSSYGRASVDRIVAAVAAVAAGRAKDDAEAAVRETGLGAVEDKVEQHLACSTGVVERYLSGAYIEPRPDSEGIVIPRPAGPVITTVPLESPVATVYADCLMALLTRNAVVLVAAGGEPIECTLYAARALAAAAVKAGAPAGTIQVVAHAPAALAESLASARTGWLAVDDAGPPNVPAFVESSADLDAAARRIVDSRSFDHGLLPTAESVVIVEEAVADRLTAALEAAGAFVLNNAQCTALRQGGGRVEDGLDIPAEARVLVAPIALIGSDEPLAGPKRYPLMALVRVRGIETAQSAARAVLRLGQSTPVAAIHSEKAAAVVAYGAALDVGSVVVNRATTDGYLPRGPAFGPEQLVRWTRVLAPEVPLPGEVGRAPTSAVPPYPVASNAARA